MRVLLEDSAYMKLRGTEGGGISVFYEGLDSILELISEISKKYIKEVIMILEAGGLSTRNSTYRDIILKLQNALESINIHLVEKVSGGSDYLTDNELFEHLYTIYEVTEKYAKTIREAVDYGTISPTKFNFLVLSVPGIGKTENIPRIIRKLYEMHKELIVPHIKAITSNVDAAITTGKEVVSKSRKGVPNLAYTETRLSSFFMPFNDIFDFFKIHISFYDEFDKARGSAAILYNYLSTRTINMNSTNTTKFFYAALSQFGIVDFYDATYNDQLLPLLREYFTKTENESDVKALKEKIKNILENKLSNIVTESVTFRPLGGIFIGAGNISVEESTLQPDNTLEMSNNSSFGKFVSEIVDKTSALLNRFIIFVVKPSIRYVLRYIINDKGDRNTISNIHPWLFTWLLTLKDETAPNNIPGFRTVLFMVSDPLYMITAFLFILYYAYVLATGEIPDEFNFSLAEANKGLKILKRELDQEDIKIYNGITKMVIEWIEGVKNIAIKATPEMLQVDDERIIFGTDIREKYIKDPHLKSIIRSFVIGFLDKLREEENIGKEPIDVLFKELEKMLRLSTININLIKIKEDGMRENINLLEAILSEFIPKMGYQFDTDINNDKRLKESFFEFIQKLRGFTFEKLKDIFAEIVGKSTARTEEVITTIDAFNSGTVNEIIRLLSSENININTISDIVYKITTLAYFLVAILLLRVYRTGEIVNPSITTKNSVERIHQFLNSHIGNYIEEVTSILNNIQKKQNYDNKGFYDKIMVILRAMLTYWIMIRSIKEFAQQISPEIVDIEEPERKIYEKINEFFENLHSVYNDIESNTDNIYARAAAIVDAVLSNQDKIEIPTTIEIELDPEVVEEANIDFDKLSHQDRNEIEKVYDLILDEYFEKVEELLEEHGITIGKPIDLRVADINELNSPYLLTLKAIYNLVKENMAGVDIDNICKENGSKIRKGWKEVDTIIEKFKGNEDVEKLLNAIKDKEDKRTIAIDMYSSFIKNTENIYNSFNNIIDSL